ncbi:MAG: hypothetical protein C0390_02615, partial [Syntrophus sp. (in: bacteria)]|nr:hypothetical protein [Syntrophus sp. (in: bacteria)]
FLNLIWFCWLSTPVRKVGMKIEMHKPRCSPINVFNSSCDNAFIGPSPFLWLNPPCKGVGKIIRMMTKWTERTPLSGAIGKIMIPSGA